MSSRRKISVRKVIQTLVTFVVAAGCVVAILSADRLQNRKKVNSVRVQIRNEKLVHFLDEEEVMRLLFTNRHLDPRKTTLGRLDIRKMEAIARSNPWVSDAQVYVDNERNLNIHLVQRVPAVRIFEWDGNSYYIDSALQAMPLSDRYAHYTPVVTNVRPLRNDSISRDVKGKIISLVRFITAHKFWNAQVSQIVMQPDGTFQLVPVLGKQRILLGDTSRMEEKFGNLYAFYQQVLNKVGWDKYETLDLRFEAQVLASPSLPWKAPIDRALSNINWVKAIMDAGPKDEKDEAVDNVSDAPGSPASPKPAVALPVTAAPKPAAAVPKPAAAVPARTVVTVPPKSAAKPTGQTAAARPKQPTVTGKRQPEKKTVPAAAAPRKTPRLPVKADPRNVKSGTDTRKQPAKPDKGRTRPTDKKLPHTTTH